MSSTAAVVDPLEVSRACRGKMHMSCNGCGCLDCHHTCSQCGKPCRVLYGDGICAGCYLASKKTEPKVRARCETCGGPAAYRDTRAPDDRYLCTECHKKAGHRYQDNGRWVMP